MPKAAVSKIATARGQGPPGVDVKRPGRGQNACPEEDGKGTANSHRLLPADSVAH